MIDDHSQSIFTTSTLDLIPHHSAQYHTLYHTKPTVLDDHGMLFWASEYRLSHSSFSNNQHHYILFSPPLDPLVCTLTTTMRFE